ncbi:Abscisic acid receptor PYL4 [Heracleum sosnowskyi]|uniref:Abscisic acid receptor PYL4 n=1 Tax=Heracleum sosnowskyi TaxID=360622 RepID=A0AAD8HEF6_9APIA|nr:Abscisic acid receptor PYL4 [Heracleum sosnowskyi]
MPSSLQLQKFHNTQDLHKPSHMTTCPTIPPSISSAENILHYHTHVLGPDQCSSAVIQTISASVSTVWSLVRSFNNPQTYKHFLKSCHIIVGDGSVGSLREVYVVSGLPADSSRERLDILDDERHVMGFSIVGGNHRLNNYRSVTTLHAMNEGNGTVVVESYVVDVPKGNTKEETCGFADTIVRCNLQSLAKIAADLDEVTSNI